MQEILGDRHVYLLLRSRAGGFANRWGYFDDGWAEAEVLYVDH